VDKSVARWVNVTALALGNESMSIGCVRGDDLIINQACIIGWCLAPAAVGIVFEQFISPFKHHQQCTGRVCLSCDLADLFI